jgi:hypothetical protein
MKKKRPFVAIQVTSSALSFLLKFPLGRSFVPHHVPRCQQVSSVGDEGRHLIQSLLSLINFEQVVFANHR